MSAIGPIGPIDSVRVKIDAAVAVSEHTPPIDGETFLARMCDRFQQVRETQHFSSCPYRRDIIRAYR